MEAVALSAGDVPTMKAVLANSLSTDEATRHPAEYIYKSPTMDGLFRSSCRRCSSSVSPPHGPPLRLCRPTTTAPARPLLRASGHAPPLIDLQRAPSLTIHDSQPRPSKSHDPRHPASYVPLVVDLSRNKQALIVVVMAGSPVEGVHSGQPEAYEFEIDDKFFRRSGDPPLDQVIEMLQKHNDKSQDEI
ncbi:hypothetical protein ACQJBY_066823 [Aegilops geniculata]